jgi:TrmH family RNA methyltransferase
LRLLTLARDLKRRKSRERQALFVAEGVRAVEELMKSRLSIKGVLTAPQLDGAQRGALLRQAIQATTLETTQVSELEFRSAAETESPQGVLAIAEIPSHSLDEFANRPRLRLLVLDGVQDPGNVGTIIRTAAALDTDATITLPGTVDPWNAKVVRGAMGAIFHHPVIASTPDEVSDFMAREEGELWGADASGDVIGSASAPARLALAVGNEGAGLSSSLRERVSRTVSLPISAAVESLNVAVAAGILLYELRQ